MPPQLSYLKMTFLYLIQNFTGVAKSKYLICLFHYIGYAFYHICLFPCMPFSIYAFSHICLFPSLPFFSIMGPYQWLHTRFEFIHFPWYQFNQIFNIRRSPSGFKLFKIFKGNLNVKKYQLNAIWSYVQ